MEGCGVSVGGPVEGMRRRLGGGGVETSGGARGGTWSGAEFTQKTYK